MVLHSKLDLCLDLALKFQTLSLEKVFSNQNFQYHIGITKKCFEIIFGLAWGPIKDCKVTSFVSNLNFKIKILIK